MKHRWLYAVGTLLSVLLLASFLLYPLPIGTTPEAACRIAMARTEGYGPWRYLGGGGVMAAGTQGILAYSDGFNTSQCFVRALGPLWFVEPIVSETVDCGACEARRLGRVSAAKL